MAHQEDYRGPYGGSDVMRDDRMRRQSTHGRDAQGRSTQGRGAQDRYGMQPSGDWHDDGASYGPPYNQNAGQEWQQSEFGHGRGNEGQGNYGQGYYGSGMNSPSNVPNNARGGTYRDQGDWRGDRDYGWSASEGYNTQPYSSGGYYGSYYARGYDQGHAGRGPRNYRRSDERIREDINEELTRHPGIDATDVDVRVENGEVTLSGMVDDRRAKRLAEDIAEQCSGVEDVHNELRIERSNRESRHGGSRASSRNDSGSGTDSDREVPRRTEHEGGRRASGSSASESESGRGKNGGSSKNAS